MVIGQSIGPYEVLAKLGEGGMGEVYRARDTRLKRDVAIKVLPAAFAGDPDRLARFQREAELLASLNHTNIAAIYGFEHAEGVHALVMELVEGPTLAERLDVERAATGSGLSVEETLSIARQIADALEAAHEKSIVHRDLKPANIKIAPDGKVKVLDFGLAKAFSPDAVSSDPARLSMSPTITVAHTAANVIMGTAAYMSPEQARGKIVDKRTDVWAFGCVLYEMLTGRLLFDGETVSDVIARILERTIDLEQLPPATPARVRLLLSRCLQKDPARRLRDIGDARLELDEPSLTSAEELPRPIHVTAPRRPVALMAAVALLLISTIALGVREFTRVPAPAAVRHVSIVAPAGKAISSGQHARPVLSPDGQYVAFFTGVGLGTELWVRRLDKPDAQLLQVSSNAYEPFWSPDSRWLAFFAEGKLLKMEVPAGKAQVICDYGTLSNGRTSGTWNADDVILFGVDTNRPLYRVKASGGAPPQQVTTIAERQQTHLRPFFLPDGDRFVYHVSGLDDVRGIYLSSLSDPKTSKPLIPGDVWSAVYASGLLVYVRGDNTLWGQHFDASSATLSGEPVFLANVSQNATGNQFALFSVSNDGTLAYRTPEEEPRVQLMLVDRSGKTVGTIGVPDYYSNLRASPDGRQLAAQVRTENGLNVRLYDWGAHAASPMTLDAGGFPLWSSDSTQVGLVQLVGGSSQRLVIRSASGQGDARLVVQHPPGAGGHMDDWSPDGKFVTLSRVSPTTNRDVLLLPLDGSQEPVPLLNSPSNETQGRISPDGRWIAYTSDESGQPEIWVQAFPKLGGKRKISDGGGAQALWRADGKELFYLSLDRHIMAVPISAGAAPGTPARVFDLPVYTSGFNGIGTSALYAVSRDGQQFVLASAPEQREVSPIQLILGWPLLVGKP